MVVGMFTCPLCESVIPHVHPDPRSIKQLEADFLKQRIKVVGTSKKSKFTKAPPLDKAKT